MVKVCARGANLTFLVNIESTGQPVGSISQYQVHALAPRRVAVGRLVADGADPCHRLARPLPRTGPPLGRPVEGRLARCVLVWDVSSLSCAFSALSEASESPGPGRACPRAQARASTGNRVRPRHPSHSAQVGPTPGPTAPHERTHARARARARAQTHARCNTHFFRGVLWKHSFLV